MSYKRILNQENQKLTQFWKIIYSKMNLKIHNQVVMKRKKEKMCIVMIMMKKIVNQYNLNIHNLKELKWERFQNILELLDPLIKANKM